MTPEFTRLAFSLYFYNQFNSTLTQAETVYPYSTVHQQPAQSTEDVWTVHLDTHDDHLWQLQRVLQYTHEDHILDKIKLRLSQMIVSPIIRSMNSIRIQSISKSVPVNRGI